MRAPRRHKDPTALRSEQEADLGYADRGRVLNPTRSKTQPAGGQQQHPRARTWLRNSATGVLRLTGALRWPGTTGAGRGRKPMKYRQRQGSPSPSRGGCTACVTSIKNYCQPPHPRCRHRHSLARPLEQRAPCAITGARLQRQPARGDAPGRAFGQGRTSTNGSTRMTSCRRRECTQPSHRRKSSSLRAHTSICAPHPPAPLDLTHVEGLGSLPAPGSSMPRHSLPCT